MKLYKWTLAGASAYLIYKYSIGKKAKGEDVFISPERSLEDAAQGDEVPARAQSEAPKRRKTRTAQKPGK